MEVTKIKSIKMGRPTKYRGAETLKKGRDYLDQCVPERIRRTVRKSPTSESHKYYVQPNLPTMAGLSLYLGISRSTLYEWKNIYPDFSDLLERLLAEQEETLINYGLSGEFNASIVKLILCVRHGYREQHTVKYETAASVFDDDDDE
jgi:hypothetical protein